MKNVNIRHSRNNRTNYTSKKYQIFQSYGINTNLRRKSLAVLDTKIKSSFSNLNSLLDKINNAKDLVINDKFDVKDVKSLKNLDNNVLLLSKSFAIESKKAAKLSYGYNLSSYDLDTFLKNFRKKKKKRIGKKEVKTNDKNEEIKQDNINDYKNEFDLAYLGKNIKEKIENNSFLKNQKKMRDLYNLKLELNLIEQRKKIGEKRTFDAVKRAPNCLIDRDQRKNPKFSRIKSKYYEMYQLSKSFEIEEGILERNILNEINQFDDEKYNINKKDILLTNNTKENDTTNKNMFHITKRTILKNLNNKLSPKNRKSLSAKNIRNNNNHKKIKNFNNSEVNIIDTQNNDSNFKQAIRLKLKDGFNFNKNNNSNNLYKKIYKSNFRNRNIPARHWGTNLTTKQTLYSSKSSSRPISSLTAFNNTTYHFKNKKIYNNNSMILNTNTIGQKEQFRKYVSEINKIIKYSDYSTEKFKKSTNELNKKKLFSKSTNKIFEKEKVLNIDKIIKNLKLDKNPHTSINDKRLIYNNSLNVKLMLNLRNREILNTVILKLFDEERRVNKFFIDASLYEKFLKKFEMNKVFNLLSNKIINFEKKNDKEKILEMFEKDEENVLSFMKKKEKKEKFSEDEYKFILLKNKNMKIMDKEKNRELNLKGNLYKKHLVSKYKKLD